MKTLDEILEESSALKRASLGAKKDAMEAKKLADSAAKAHLEHHKEQLERSRNAEEKINLLCEEVIDQNIDALIFLAGDCTCDEHHDCVKCQLEYFKCESHDRDSLKLGGRLSLEAFNCPVNV